MDSEARPRVVPGRARLLGYVTAIVRDPHLAATSSEVTLLAMQRAGGSGATSPPPLGEKSSALQVVEALRASGGGGCPGDDVLDALEAEWDAAGSDAAGSDAAAEQVHDLRGCMQRLSARARRILHLRYSDGLSGLQLAETLTIGVASVYVALSRIHRALRDCMARRRGMAGETDERVVAGQFHKR